jgi:hypothetical protein
MGLFYADSIVVGYTNLEAAKKWWMEAFECKQSKLPDWDCPLPSDIALSLPGSREPTILLNDRAEVERAGFERDNRNMIVFSTDVKKAHKQLSDKGFTPGPIQNSSDTEFFEIRDPEGNVIEICREP